MTIGEKDIILTLKHGFQIKISYNEDIVIPPYPISALLLANNLIVSPGDKVLDIGTGTGIQSIVAKKMGAKNVLATDISTEVLTYAIKNFQQNDIYCDSIKSNLFQEIIDKDFDLIIANPPMFASKRKLLPDVYGGPTGRDLLDQIITDSIHHLKSGGRLIIPTESYIGFKETEQNLKNTGYIFRKIAEGIAPCGLQMLQDLNYSEMKGKLSNKNGVYYFSSRIYEATISKTRENNKSE